MGAYQELSHPKSYYLPAEQVIDDNFERLAEAVYFIIANATHKPHKLGKTKLHKILWFAIATLFEENDANVPSLVGKFIKMPFGPYLKNMDKIIDSLREKNYIKSSKKHFFDNKTNQDLSIFSNIYELTDTSMEIKLLNKNEQEILLKIASYVINETTATEISEISHNIMWEIAANGEELSPTGAFLTKYPIN